MRRILITGGSGLLALNWAMAARDCSLVTLGMHKRNVVVPGVQSLPINLESVDDFMHALETVAPHVVIHAAGLTSVEQCEFNPELAHHVNVTLAANVAKACDKTGVDLVHVSTDHLFSGRDSLVDEKQPADPINVYGITKAEAEDRVLAINPHSLVIRTNFYGWGASYRQSFSDHVIDALRNGSNLTLFNDVFYTPILVETLALVVNELIDLKVNGILNIVGDERISKYQFGICLSEEFGLHPEKIICSSLSDQKNLVKRPFDMSLSNQKVCTILGRRLGGVTDHLARLHQQELNGLAQEIRKC